MKKVRCSLCRQQMPTLKLLISHYIIAHSKLKIVREIIKCNISRSTPKLLRRKYKKKTRNVFRKPKKSNRKCAKNETLFLNENVHILCSQNELVIGDDSKDGRETKFSFTNTSSPSKECQAPEIEGNNNIPSKKIKVINKRFKTNKQLNVSTSSSSDNIDNSDGVKRRIRYKKESLTKLGHYRINITKLKNQQSLDECTGEFYICNCRERYEKECKLLQEDKIRIVMSDTESCSDPGKSSDGNIPEKLLFCTKCANGYKTERELADHVQIHETFCRLCNEHFVNEQVFKEHMRLHIYKVYMCHICRREFPFRNLLQIHFECHLEDRTFETVLDMEEDYTMCRYNFTNMNYNSSINSILLYLSDSSDFLYHNQKFMKMLCELCFNEVFVCDYEQHLQNVHFCGF